MSLARWWAKQDSNLRPLPCKGSALPAELFARLLRRRILYHTSRRFVKRSRRSVCRRRVVGSILSAMSLLEQLRRRRERITVNSVLAISIIQQRTTRTSSSIPRKFFSEQNQSTNWSRGGERVVPVGAARRTAPTGGDFQHPIPKLNNTMSRSPSSTRPSLLISAGRLLPDSPKAHKRPSRSASSTQPSRLMSPSGTSVIRL